MIETDNSKNAEKLSIGMLVEYRYFRKGGYVFIRVCLIVCLFAGLRKSCSTDFHKIGGKVAHEPRKNH